MPSAATDNKTGGTAVSPPPSVSPGGPPLRILMVLHLPWDRNLGGSRVQVELADEMQAQGHTVEKFDLNDAFAGEPPRSRISNLLQSQFALFSRRAGEYVKKNGHRFDIIDCHQGNLPYTKEELGFRGLLVARSVGLWAFYHRFEEEAARLWPEARGTATGYLLAKWRRRQDKACFVRSLKTCDLINVCNKDEGGWVCMDLNRCEDCIVHTLGIGRQRRDDLARAAQPPQKRQERKEVAFIGIWGTRKGSQDWGKIITGVRNRVPDARFLFLGTVQDEAAVLRDLNLPSAEGIRVIPKYSSEELPELLSGATVGAFPSYIEGFGIAVTEKLASGLPTVAYNVPGPREMLSHFGIENAMMTTRGDTEAMASRIADLLTLPLSEYTRLSDKSKEIAGHFLWEDIARSTLADYQARWEALNIPAVGSGTSR